MADNKTVQIPHNRSHLDALADKFADGRDSNDFNEFMMELENSMVFVPAQGPENMSPEMQEKAKSGQPIPIDKDHQPRVVLLAKDDGEKVLPVFTSESQIPQDKRPPAIMNIPFKMVIGILKANINEVKNIAVNPFTKGFVLNENLIDLVDRRYKAGANEAGPQGQPVRLTEDQMRAIAHVKMARELLPKKLFADPEKVLGDIKLGKEKYILSAYREAYPQNAAIPYSEDDIAVMTLQIEDDLAMTRIDLPEKHTQEGSPLRIYITKEGDRIGYYLIERGGKELPSMIATVLPDGTHEKLEEAPENGAEIEAIMGLLKPS